MGQEWSARIYQASQEGLYSVFWLKVSINLNPVQFMLVNNIVLILLSCGQWLCSHSLRTLLVSHSIVSKHYLFAGPRVWLCQRTSSWVDWFDIWEQTTRTSGHWSQQRLPALLLWGQSQYPLELKCNVFSLMLESVVVARSGDSFFPLFHFLFYSLNVFPSRPLTNNYYCYTSLTFFHISKVLMIQSRKMLP